MRRAWLLVLIGCGSTTSEPPPAAPAPPPKRPVACDPAVPAAACAQRVGLRVCEPAARDRVGEWRYALIAPLYADTDALTSAELAAHWKAGDIEASAETARAVTALLGPGTPRPLEPHPTHLAIVAAHELGVPYDVLPIDGHHPLDRAPGPLALPLCAAGGGRVRNIDPDKLTTVAITGVTALTRGTAALIDRKGVTYPVRDVEPWLRSADLVHISNEVSFVPKGCEPTKRPHEFCSRESYIALLEAAHAKIIELDGSHLHDYGREWIDHTLDLYQQRGWIWFGGGRNQLDASAPKIVEDHGNKLGFLGCNQVITSWRLVTEGPGVAACDFDRMRWQIGELLRAGIVPIVSVQHQEVYHHEPPEQLVHDFRSLADAGAAFVNGSQAHSAHPWEVHKGAFVHYGGGNFFFDQQAPNTQDATADMLYVHAGKLLAVGRLYTRLEEHGRPRPLTPPERTGFLAAMRAALAKLPAADPWGAPHVVPAGRQRPDSFLHGRDLVRLTVTVPAHVEPGVHYPLVIGAAHDDAAYVVVPRGHAPAAAISAFMAAKYAIDRARVTVEGAPPAERTAVAPHAVPTHRDRVQ